MQEGDVDAQDVQDAMRSAQTLGEDGTPRIQEYEEGEIPRLEEVQIQSNHQSRDCGIPEESEAHEHS